MNRQPSYRAQILALSPFLALALPAFSQSGAPSGPPSGGTLAVPGPLGDAEFGKAVAGDLDADGVLDAVVLDDGVPSMLYSPETFYTDIKVKESDGTTPRVVNDLAIAPGRGANGEDVLFIVDDEGLVEIPYDDTDGWGTAIVHDDDDWAGALLLQLGHVDTDGYLDAVGVDANGQTVRVLRGDSSGGFTGGSSSFATTGTGAHDLQLFELDPANSDAGQDIAVFTSAGIGVHTELGTIQGGYAWSKAMVAGVIDDPSPGANGAQRLVIVTKVGANDFLFLWDRNGKETAINLGALGTVRMATGDLRGSDDLDDVLLSVTSEAGYYALEQQTSGSTFSASAMDLVEIGIQTRDTSSNDSGLAVGDFDNDGDQDVLAFASYDGTEVGEFVLARRKTTQGGIGHAGHRPTVTYEELEYLYQATDPIWRVELERPVNVLTPGANETYDLEYSVWHTSDFDLSPDPQDPDQWTSETPLISKTYAAMPPQAMVPPVMQINLPLSSFGTNDVYTLVARPVIRDSAGAVVERGTALTILLGSGSNLYSLYDLRGEFDSGHVDVWTVYESGTRGIGSDPVGGGSGSSSGPTGPGSENDAKPQS